MFSFFYKTVKLEFMNMYIPSNFLYRPLFFLHLISLVFIAGCAPKMIPNTQVPDNSDNREVIEFTEKYRKAVESRDIEKLLMLASEQYLDDNGTPIGSDDVDYEQLKTKFLAWKEKVLDVRYEMKYRRVTYENEKIFVDYTYSASFQVETPEGNRWARRLADNRLVLERQKNTGSFRILSGM